MTDYEFQRTAATFVDIVVDKIASFVKVVNPKLLPAFVEKVLFSHQIYHFIDWS